METVAVTDLYQASYFLLSGCALTGIECVRSGMPRHPAGMTKHLVCTLYFVSCQQNLPLLVKCIYHTQTRGSAISKLMALPGKSLELREIK